MSRLVAEAYHPLNDSTEEIWDGFSWPCLCCGFLWYMYKGMWGWGIIALILAFGTLGISWLIFPFFANEQHARSLLQRGYVNESQRNEGRGEGKRTDGIDAKNRLTPSVADELVKLAALKTQGVLTDEEFNTLKLKVFSQGTASDEGERPLTRTPQWDQSLPGGHSSESFVKCPECLHTNRDDAHKCRSCSYKFPKQ
ncbi:MAG: SHOCT domain-containing protein [Nitrospirales bacterium]